MCDFNIGDRVRCIGNYDGNNYIVGEVGTICESEMEESLLVRFDNNINGHGGNDEDGDIEYYGHYWFFFKKYANKYLQKENSLEVEII